VPNHSVLTKALKRWGVEVFTEFFERIVWQCIQAGLVDGRKIFMDSSLVEADASCNSVMDTQSLKYQVAQKYAELEERLDEGSDKRYVRPDAKPVKREKSEPRVQAYRLHDKQISSSNG
jgi:hypothetical protein